MDEKRFDAWTRRRFGLAVGGAAVSALGLLGAIGLSEEDAEAARRNRNNNRNRNRNRNRRRDQCRKLGQTCNDNRRRQQCCNSAQLCAQVPNLGTENFCCKQRDSNCSIDDDCCGRSRCRNGVCTPNPA